MASASAEISITFGTKVLKSSISVAYKLSKNCSVEIYHHGHGIYVLLSVKELIGEDAFVIYSILKHTVSKLKQMLVLSKNSINP